MTIFDTLYDNVCFADEGFQEQNNLLAADMTDIVMSVLPRCRALFTRLFNDVGGLHIDKILGSLANGMPLLEEIRWKLTRETSRRIAAVDIGSCTALRILEGPLN